jgi:hypothetical protein
MSYVILAVLALLAGAGLLYAFRGKAAKAKAEALAYEDSAEAKAKAALDALKKKL